MVLQIYTFTSQQFWCSRETSIIVRGVDSCQLTNQWQNLQHNTKAIMAISNITRLLNWDLKLGFKVRVVEFI